jgi:hypothetical protein
MLRRTVFFVIAMGLVAGTARSGSQQEMEAAAKSGKLAFVLVYEQAGTDLEKARELVSDAMTRVPGSVKIELNRSDAANADVVTKYRLKTAPMPLILVASPAGVIAGGVPAQQATVDRLVKLVPSPKKTEIIRALSEGNAVFITASRASMKSADAVNKACAMAGKEMAGKSVQIKIDMDDPAEAGFLTEMKVNLQTPEPVTLVANAQGQLAGRYTGSVQVADLVSAAKKKVTGCCPSTVSNPDASCGPVKQ